MTPILVAVFAVLLVLVGFTGRQWYRYRGRYLAAKQTVAKQDTEIGRLTEQVRLAQGNVQHQGDAISQLNQRLQRLQDQAEDSSNEFNLSQHEIVMLRSAKLALAQKLERQADHIETINHTYRQTVDQLSQTIDTLNGEKERLSQNLHNSNQELVQLYRDIEDTIAEEVKEYTEQIEQLTATVKQLEKDRQDAVNARVQEKETGLLFKATEHDLYPEEKKAIVLDILQNALEGLPARSRRETVVQNIVDYNRNKFYRDTLRDELRKWFKAYNGMNRKMRHALEHLGFQIETEGGHYKMRFQDDGRYKLTFAKTPSDWRNGRNIIKEIRSRFL